MFDKSKETQNSLNDAAQSVDEVAQEVKKQMSKFDQTVTSVKAHIRRHKTAYTVGGTVAVITPIAFVGGMNFRRPIEIINEVRPIIAPVFNNHNIGNKIEQTVNLGGHCTKIIQRLSDKEIFEQAGDAAYQIHQKYGISYERARWLLSRHLNGHLSDVYGEIYKTIGTGTTGVADSVAA